MRYAVFSAPRKDLLWLHLDSSLYPKGSNCFLLCNLFLNFMQLKLCVVFFFCIWLRSVNIWPVKFIYTIARNTNSFWLLCNIPFCEYALFVCPICLSIYCWWILGCCKYWAIMNKTVMSILCVYLYVYFSGVYSRVENLCMSVLSFGRGCQTGL